MGKKLLKEELINDLKNYVSINGYKKLRLRDFNSKNNLKTIKNYKDCLGGKLSDWLQLCGIKLTDDEIYNFDNRKRNKKITKEECIKLIYDMQSKLNRPLMYDDFRKSGANKTTISNINKFWGSLNKMKEDLGLEIIQEDMTSKKLDKKDFIEHINFIVSTLKKDEYNFVTTKIIDSDKRFIDSSTLRRYAKEYLNLSFTELFELYDIKCSKSGCGMNYDFEDGEHVSSLFEYMFSKYLKNYGLKYDKDYFRNVRYLTFIKNYKGMKDCDYVINYNNKTIYIEIAGLIENYKLWYYNDKPITNSKSKENYKIKLKEKEQMLKDNNLIYFILFPCDLTKENFEKILNDSSLPLKREIESFHKHNIDWVKIQQLGELNYKGNTNRELNIVDYGEQEMIS